MGGTRLVTLALAVSGLALVGSGCGGDGGGVSKKDMSGMDRIGTDTITPPVDLGPDQRPPTPDLGGMDAGPCQGIECVLPPIDCSGSGGMGAAGQVTEANKAQELLAGPAAHGLVGDFYLRNDKIRVIVQGPNRAIGPAPYGGNIIDAYPVGGAGFDQFGELSPVLQFGRTVNFTRGAVVCDGSAGGPVALRFYGTDAINDYINLPGLLPSSLTATAPNPNDSVGLEVAATYVLNPGSNTVELTWSYLNTGSSEAAMAFGTISDTGGEVSVFAPGFGFGEVGLSPTILTENRSIPYAAFVAPGPTKDDPGIAYGIHPRFSDGSLHSQLAVAGVHVFIFKSASLLDILGPNGMALVVPAGEIVDQQIDFTVARDPGGVLSEVLARTARPKGTISGKVTVGAGAQAGVRVAVFDNTAGNSDVTPNSKVVSLYSTDMTGAFQGDLPPGRYLIQAEQIGYLKSAAADVTVAENGTVMQDLAIAESSTIDFQVTDADTMQPIPAKITVIGKQGRIPDNRFREIGKEAQPTGTVRIVMSATGSSAMDGPIEIEPNGAGEQYRVIVSRGPEYTIHDEKISLAQGGNVQITASLKRAYLTPGYLAGDFHQHTLNSPDSPVPLKDRVISYLVEGVEFVATTDHDYVSDYAPYIAELGAESLLSSIIGVEATAWDYGHFNVYPVTPDPTSPNNGAVDWGGGDGLFNLTPAEIFEAYVARGAQVRQVNHPRVVPSTGIFETAANFQATWDRAGLTFDFVNKVADGSPQVQPVPNDVLRLDPSKSIFTKDMDAVEIFNGFRMKDSDGDGVREDILVDRNLRDYMNLISFGIVYTPMGTSDTHSRAADPGGSSRTYIRVPDDSTAAILAGPGNDITATINGSSATGRDVVVTNGPFMRLDIKPDDGTCAIPAGPDICSGDCTRQGGTAQVTQFMYQVTVDAPLWGQVDTVELFVGNTYDPLPKPVEMGGQTVQPDTALTPTICWSASATPGTKCQAGQFHNVPTENTTSATAQRFRVVGCFDPSTLTPRAGAVGSDTFVLARAYGQGALFPVIPNGVPGNIDPADLVNATSPPTAYGVFPLAITSAVLLDVDGNGWKAPFSQ